MHRTKIFNLMLNICISINSNTIFIIRNKKTQVRMKRRIKNDEQSTFTFIIYLQQCDIKNYKIYNIIYRFVWLLFRSRNISRGVFTFTYLFTIFFN